MYNGKILTLRDINNKVLSNWRDVTPSCDNQNVPEKKKRERDISTSVEAIAFADDVLIYVIGKNMSAIQEKLQSTVELVQFYSTIGD